MESEQDQIAYGPRFRNLLVTPHPFKLLLNKAGCLVVFSRGGNFIMRDPFTASLLSFFVPGVGQLYNGRILAGILWLIITPGFWIGSGGTLGWICHIIAAYTAYSYAKDHPVRA
jgi:TM2 domain-containing membrane protein YozV